MPGCSGPRKAQGWDLDTYRAPTHPLQAAVLEAVRSASGFDDPTTGIDGCGVVVHGMPLRGLATIYARLASPGRLGPLEPHARRAVAAMIAQPYLVAGRNRVDTAVMRTMPGIVVKSGAEALICAAIPTRGLGVAVKIADGSSRATGPALIRALQLLDVMGSDVTGLVGGVRRSARAGWRTARGTGGGGLHARSGVTEPVRARVCAGVSNCLQLLHKPGTLRAWTYESSVGTYASSGRARGSRCEASPA